MALSLTLWTIYEWWSPTYMELAFMLVFALGFFFLRMDKFLKRSGRKFAGNLKKFGDTSLPLARPQAQLHRGLEAQLSAGHPEAALNIWRTGKKRLPTPMETLKVVTQAFLQTDADNLVQEITEHINVHREVLCQTHIVTAVLDVIAHSGHVVLMEEFATLAQKEQPGGLEIPPCSQIYEVLIGGYATAGDEPRVKALLAEFQENCPNITPRAYALTIKGFLKNSMLDAALQQILDMQTAGFFVPLFAMSQLFRNACEAGRAAEIFDRVSPLLQVPSDAIVLLLDDAHKRTDLKFALHVEKTARDHKIPLLVNAYDSLLKVCVVHADLHALQFFEDMQRDGLRISEGLCVGLLARCAESKFLRFAEAIATFVRGRDGMTIGVYSSLMKCYAYCGMYDKACDLYDQICAAGMEPDSMMYGCLMKFSVECGRTELSRKLFETAPSLDIQNYMSLFRAARRNKDVDWAFSLLNKLKTSGVAVDIAAYSCVLDVCVSAGDMAQARNLIEQMKSTLGTLDIITFNTLLKGYCALGDFKGAKELLKEMKSLGFPPNDVSFNCLINAAVSQGDYVEAWQIVEMMENSGVPVDHCTISIMMKSLKRVKHMKYVNQAFDLLDRVGLDVCSDEVLLNTVLKVCIRHGNLQRLSTILDAFFASSQWPCVHTYAILIKACSALKRVDRCWELWQVMVEHRGMEPNDIVLGCMLDALVCNEQVDDAVALFRKWQDTLPPNTVLYCTIIKGFANSRQATRAMDMWREMRRLGLPMSNMVYHAVIDAQARVGAMDEVSMLVEDMAANKCELDAIFHSTIVKGYCIKGDLNKAFEMFRSMQSNDMAVDCIIYNTVLDGCIRHNRMDLADTVIEDMEKHSIKPSIFTLSILVKMYGRRRELDKAFEVLSFQEQKHGIRPNLQVKTNLMVACLYNHDFDRALGVFEDLKASGQGADAKAYGALITGIVRNSHDRLPEAVELVKEAYGLNTRFSEGRSKPRTPPGLKTEALEQLLRALGSQGMTESVGIPLMDQLRSAGVPIGGRLFSSFLGGLR